VTAGCDFSLRHYGEILDLAVAAGYRFASFTEPLPRGRAMLLRHDLDFSAAAALPVAELEAARGISATYFVLTSSPTYSPFEPANAQVIRRVHALGHRIGLHLDERTLATASSARGAAAAALRLLEGLSTVVPVERAVSFHQPSPAVLGRSLPGIASAYAPRFFSRIPYRSDSARVWRDGCICTTLRDAPPPRLQLLTHPIWWSARERTAAQVMAAMRTARRADVDRYLGVFRPFAPLLPPREGR